jgi:ATP-dependent Clp protease ATP-binding subunit ClpB
LQDLNSALNEAEKRAKEMGDQYVSVEHLFLGLMKKANTAMKKLFETYCINKKRFWSS